MEETSGNRLGQAVSPYLLQHKDNPVHWREWSDAALAEAAERDRPILLSVGYAACHWCHVMAHESFEDDGVAAVMNRLFVNVKVDREERPDLDHVYMTALQAMGEHGGWPMTMFLTPDGKPFWGGTYFPKNPGFGRPGFVQVLEAVARAWENDRENLTKSAGAVASKLGEFLSTRAGGAEIPSTLTADTAAKIRRLLDFERGGTRGAPKFPSAPMMEVVARSAFPNGPAEDRRGFLLTLEGLSTGGIYDHLGGGLHRYSVDDRWLVPHFEKMLYDNAQYLRHLLWGWRATGAPLFRKRIEETVGWLKREMIVGGKGQGGGFAASLDADSADAAGHMEEGAFYVWREAEIDAVLDAQASDFKAAYDVTPGGNWEGKTVLNRLGTSAAEIDPDAFAGEKAKLLDVRAERARPGRDDKVLADWNGLAIRALAEIAQSFRDSATLALGENAFAFVMDNLVVDGRLHHAWREGKASGLAFASDHGALILAATSLFAATKNETYLTQAKTLADALERWHSDGEGGHYMTASDAGDVILRPRGDQDEAVPAGTALVVEALTVLAQASGSVEIAERAERAARLAAGRIAERPAAFPGLVAALDRLARQSELALFGEPGEPVFEAMAEEANRFVDLSRLDLAARNAKELPETLPLAAMKAERMPAAFLCTNRVCRPPVFDAGQLTEMLEGR